MFVLIKMAAIDTEPHIYDVQLSNNLEKLQKIMYADFDRDLKKENDFWMKCRCPTDDKPVCVRDSYSVKIKTPVETKSWSIKQVSVEGKTMKSILITYDTETWNGEAWEQGEAATKLDFIDAETANDLMRFANANKSRMNEITHLRWRKLEQIVQAIEFLRQRSYVDGSIKSVKIIESQGSDSNA